MAQLVCTLAIACAAQFLARGSSRSLACSGSKAPTPGSAAEFHVTTVVSIYVWPVLLVEVSDGTTSVHVGYCMCGAICSSRKFQVVGVQWLEGTHPLARPQNFMSPRLYRSMSGLCYSWK